MLNDRGPSPKSPAVGGRSPGVNINAVSRFMFDTGKTQTMFTKSIRHSTMNSRPQQGGRKFNNNMKYLVLPSKLIYKEELNNDNNNRNFTSSLYN